MTDETIRVVYDVTERGMQNVRKLVGDIRKELGQSGVDTSRFETRLEGLERTVKDVSNALKAARTAATATGAAGAAAGERTATSWRKAKSEIDAAMKLANRGINAGTKSQNAGGTVGAFKADGMASWDREFAKASASAKKFEADWIKAGKEIERALITAGKGIDAATSQQNRSSTVGNAKKSAMDLWDKEFAAATASAKKFEESQGNIIAQRYALYDVANTYALIGGALAGAAIYAGVVGARFESAFTNVERTLQGGTLPAEVDEIRQSLIRLSGQIPLTFEELAQIATIGNQMGIAKDEIVDFTSTIARFASVSGMSIDEVTKAFGGFAAQTGLDPKYFENLGSSIAKVGIDSNATETQIVSLMKEIAAGGKGAGFTADQIVGLAGTLAGLQIAPERARGALDTYFGTLDRAVANGGQDLENFALVVGVTADELERMVRNGEGADVMRGFLEGLNGADDSVALTQALDALNLSQLRVSNTFKRLSGDLSIFDRDQRNANTAFMEGAELTRQYAMTVDDLASQWTIFINNINAFIDAVTGGAVPGLAALFTVVNNVISALSQWLGDNQWAASLIAFTVAVGGALGVILLFRAASMSATAALLAMRVLTMQAGGAAIVAQGGFRGLIGTLFGVRTAAGAAAGGIFTLRSAIRALLASTGIGLLVTLGGSLLDGMIGQGGAAEDAALSLEEYNKAVSSAAKSSGDGADGANKLADSVGGAGDAASSTAQKLRTLVDYVNDLSGAFKRSGDIRFGSTAAMDEVSLKWIELNEQAEEYQRTIRTLTADRSLQSYWLGIAELYNDQIRAGQLRENIAKIDDEMADAQQGASRELKGNSRAAIENRQTMRGLLGSYEDYVTALANAGASQEEIQRVLTSLNGDFTTQATALGYAGGELAAYQQRFADLAYVVASVPTNITVAFDPNPAVLAMNEFFARAAADAAAAGAGAGGAYGGGVGSGIDDSLFDYNAFPDEVFTDPALESGKGAGDNWWDSMMAEWASKQYQWIPLVGAWMTQIGTWWGTGGKDWAISVWNGFITELNALIRSLKNINLGGWSPFSGLGDIPLAAGARTRRGGGQFASGGYTGPGHWLQPAGIVHAGEYVIPKKFVNQSTGLPDMNYVSSLTKSKSAGPGYAMGGHVTGATGFQKSIELGPASLNYLANALTVRLSVGSRDLAAASSQGDKQLAFAGSN